MLGGHNFDPRAKSSWEDVWNVHIKILSRGFCSKVEIAACHVFKTKRNRNKGMKDKNNKDTDKDKGRQRQRQTKTKGGWEQRRRLPPPSLVDNSPARGRGSPPGATPTMAPLIQPNMKTHSIFNNTCKVGEAAIKKISDFATNRIIFWMGPPFCEDWERFLEKAS